MSPVTRWLNANIATTADHRRVLLPSAARRKRGGDDQLTLTSSWAVVQAPMAIVLLTFDVNECETPGDLAGWIGVLETSMGWADDENLCDITGAAITELQKAFTSLLRTSKKHVVQTS